MCVPSPSFERLQMLEVHMFIHIYTQLTFYLGLIASQMCVKTYLIPSSLFLISIFTISIECSTYYKYIFFSILQIQKRLKSHPVQLAPATNRVHKNPCLWSYVMLPMTYLGPDLIHIVVIPSDIGKSA